MKKVILLLVLMSFSVDTLFAQNDSIIDIYMSLMDNIYSEIDTTDISTGVFLERSVSMIDFNEFNGNDTSFFCDTYSWMKAYKQLYLAHLNLDEFDYVDSLIGYYPRSITENEQIQLGMIFYEYNRFDYYALNDNLIVLDSINHKIIDISGPVETPFAIDSCFVIAPFATEIDPGTYTFYINPDLFFSNITANFDELYIDFYQGRGYEIAGIGSMITVSYSEIGQKTISLKAIFNNDTIIGNGYITVVEPYDPREEVLPDFGPQDFVEADITAEYGIYYRCDVDEDKNIRKPYLIVSGYDPGDKNRVRDEGDKVNLYRVANKDGFLDKLRDDGFDIIIYRSTESIKSIIANAMNLVGFINKINSEKTSDNELIIAGASMGGLVTRYALTSMENDGLDHQTKLFISVDSPQNGANVPLGIQFLVKNLHTDLNGIITIVKELEKVKENTLDAVAAKQMLLYHYSANDWVTAKCSSERTDFINNLASIGNFPSHCRNIAISMGSGTGNSQGFLSSASLLKKNPGIISDLILPGSNLRWEFEVFAVPDESLSPIYTEMLSFQQCVKMIFIIPWPPWIVIETVCLPFIPLIPQRLVAVNNTVPIDNAPGSVQNLHNTEAFGGRSEVLGFEIRKLLLFFGDIDFDPNPDCFIPSYSALGLNAVSVHEDIKEYFSAEPNVITVNNNQYVNLGGEGISYFDIMYIENVNDDHIIDENNMGVFSEEMLSLMYTETSPEDLFVENETISSGQSITHEAKYNVTVGTDVDEIPYNNGPVVVEPEASYSLLANETIKLMPSFHANRNSNVLVVPSAEGYCPPGTIVSNSSGGFSRFGTDNLSEKNGSKSGKAANTDMFNLVTEASKPVLFYPNPTIEKIYISSNKENNELALYSLDGSVIYKRKFYRSTEIDLSKQQAGIYIVKVIQENGKVITEQIIKQ